jgi:hypothetical protein
MIERNEPRRLTNFREPDIYVANYAHQPLHTPSGDQ